MKSRHAAKNGPTSFLLCLISIEFMLFSFSLTQQVCPAPKPPVGIAVECSGAPAGGVPADLSHFYFAASSAFIT
jgi:hypothetical protein